MVAYLRLLCLIILVMFFYGCSISPKPIKNDAQLNQTYTKLQKFMWNQPAIGKSVTLPEAIARTLKYNLDHHVQQAQLLLESGNLKMAYLEMLPAITADGNYSFRNNNYIQNNIAENGTTTSQSTVTPREITTSSIQLQWNLLDLGLSYTRAQQQANRMMAAEEQRRKITQKLVQEVITAYWKAWTAQIMLNDVKNFKEQAQQALERSKKITNEKVRSSRYELSYQQLLIRSIRKANQLTMQIDSAKSNLMRLMNVPPGSNFSLVEPDIKITSLPTIQPQLDKMDILALVYRPELREASYLTQIAQKGIRAAVINMLPGIKFDFGYQYSNNKFLVNNEWSGGNINATWNLINAVIQGPASISIAKQNYNLEQLKQAAITMAVLTQVRVSYRNYLLWKEDYKYANEQAEVSKNLYTYAEKLLGANQNNQQDVIQRGIEALNAQFERQVAFSNAHEALSKLYQSIGIDTLPIDSKQYSLKQLTAVIRTTLEKQSDGNFNQVVEEKYAELAPAFEKAEKELNNYQSKNSNLNVANNNNIVQPQKTNQPLLAANKTDSNNKGA